MAFDRDTTVQCLKRHYDLLVRLAYLSPDVVLNPPPEGWSDDELAVDMLRALGRSDTVIDLLRHMPYLRLDWAARDVRWEVYPETRSISYLNSGGDLRGKMLESCHNGLFDVLLIPFEGDPPDGFISLAGGRESTCWVIDTNKGLVHPVGWHVLDDTAPESQWWRRNGGLGRDIKEYFDEVNHAFETLELVPVPPWAGPRIIHGLYREGKVIKHLYEEHGWPDSFRREDYVQSSLSQGVKNEYGQASGQG